jgi:hypothetical protein
MSSDDRSEKKTGGAGGDGAPLALSAGLVEETRKVVQERDRVADLLKTAEDGRDKVKPEIFAKVSSDYRAKLDSIASQYAPLRARIVEELGVIRRREHELRSELGGIRDQLDELRFRCEVGEFDRAELEKREAERKDTIEQLEGSLSRIEATYETAGELLGDELEAALSGAAPPPPVAAAPASRARKPAPGVKAPPAPPVAAQPEVAQPEVSEPEVSEPEVSEPEGAAEVEAGPEVAPVDVTEEQTGPAPPRPAPPPPVAAAADGPVPEGTVALEPGPPPPARPKTTGSADTRALTQGLLTRKKPDGGKTFVIDSDGLVLGRSTSCDVLIQGATVSRRHAVITWEEDGYWIEDVSSGGGISVNGERHQRVRLASGDQVEIGAALFEYEGP